MGRSLDASTGHYSVGLGSPTLSIWSPLAIHHMHSAAYFARQSGLVELSGQKSEWRKCRGYVTASIVLAAASFEAAINEVYRHAVDGPSRPFQNLPSKVPESLAEFWGFLEKHRASTLEKYEIALRLADRPIFDHGEDPYQSAADVLYLRNALVHFKPEWDTDDGKHARIEDRLATKFVLSPFWSPGDAFFPKRCLSYGCACWSVQSLATFLRLFAHRMDLVGIFRHFEFDLDMENASDSE